MRWQIAFAAEILRRGDQAPAEELRPPAVHVHPGGEGIVAAHQEARQAETIRRRIREQRQGRGRSRLDALGRIEEVAAFQDVRGPRPIQLLHDQGAVEVTRLAVLAGLSVTAGEALALRLACIAAQLQVWPDKPDRGVALRLVRRLGLDRRAVEIREQPVVVAHRERVVLVIVALAALEGGAEPDGRGRVHPVENLVDPVFLGIGAGLDVAGSAAVQAGGDFLILRGPGQEVAGDLFDGEAVEGHVGVEGLDDPVAVGPEVTEVVALEAVRVGVAGGVEPGPGPAFAVVRRAEQAVHRARKHPELCQRGTGPPPRVSAAVPSGQARGAAAA